MGKLKQHYMAHIYDDMAWVDLSIKYWDIKPEPTFNLERQEFWKNRVTALSVVHHGREIKVRYE